MNLVKDLQNGVITLETLNNDFKIKIKEYPETKYEDGSICQSRIVLNYDQIDSPKAHPYVMQCRGLILDSNHNVLCLPFDRFFNFGEVVDHNSIIDWNKASVFEKVDGSLIKIYWDGRKYCIATRGTAFAESNVGGWDLTFKDLVLKALGMTDKEFQIKCLFNLSFDHTYLCEITAMENRVVTSYSGYTLWHLATRSKVTGEYVSSDSTVNIGGVKPKEFSFNTSEDCLNIASKLPDLQEGYVVYQDGVPICKIKSPAYVAVHHIKGEGLNPKRIAELVLINEQDEYLKYFPDDAVFITPYEDALNNLINDIKMAQFNLCDVVDQKSFALAAKDFIFSAVLFQWKKKGGNIVDTLHSQPLNYKRKILLTLVGEKDE